MLPLGLSAARKREFERALRDDHTVVPTVQVLTLDHKPVADVSHMLLDGQVDVRSDSDTTRALSLQLIDERGHIGFGDNDPSDGALFMDNMIRAILSFDWPGNTGDWVDVPVFTGPIVAMKRDAKTLAIDCLGKEHFALRRAWDESVTFTVNYVTDLIKFCLRRAGETRMDIPDLKIITTETTTLWPMSQPWKHAQKLARSIGRQLFYDGRGVCRMRKLPDKALWTFADGEDGMLTSRPTIEFDVDNVRNTVWVVGRKPKGAKKKVEGWATLPGSNPFSARNLGRGPNNRGGHLVEKVENEHLKTNRNCHEHAVTVLNRINEQNVTVSYSSLLVPHLEEGDKVELDSEDAQWTHRARNFSIPLSGGQMSVSTTRHMSKGKGASVRPLVGMTWGDPATLLGAQWWTDGTAKL